MTKGFTYAALGASLSGGIIVMTLAPKLTATGIWMSVTAAIALVMNIADIYKTGRR